MSRWIHGFTFTFIFFEALYYLISALEYGSFLYLTTHQILYIVQLFCFVLVLQAASLKEKEYKPVLSLLFLHSLLSLAFFTLEDEAAYFDMDDDVFYYILAFINELSILSALFMINGMTQSRFFKTFLLLYVTGFCITTTELAYFSFYNNDIEMPFLDSLASFLTVFVALFTQLIMIRKVYRIYKEKLTATYNIFYVPESDDYKNYFKSKS